MKIYSCDLIVTPPKPRRYKETWFSYVSVMQFILRIKNHAYFSRFSVICCDLVIVDFTHMPWWRHQMEIFSALLAICAGNSPVTGEFPTQRPVTRSFDVYFDLRPKERLGKQWWGWWFETLSRSLWRHRNASGMTHWHWCLRLVQFQWGNFNSSTPRQNCHHFADGIFMQFHEWKVCILIRISLKFVPKGAIDNESALVQEMAWRRPGDKPLP